jgi:hypothetical protein
VTSASEPVTYKYMATYTPALLIASAAFGNGAANIATWRKQNTAGANTFDIHRTLVVVTPTAARTVTIEVGSTAADTTAQKILDAYALTANVQAVINWWVAVPNSSYFEGFANSTDINGMSSGYTFA